MLVKEDLYSMLMLFITKLKLDPSDPVVQKALKLVNKGVPASHVLAEAFLYAYLRSLGYKEVYIESTIGTAKCDIYVKTDLVDECIEIETQIIPVEHLLDGYRYIIARYVKKLIQVAKNGIQQLSFAYPLGVVPLIPPELMKQPSTRSHKKLEKLFLEAQRYYSLDFSEISYLAKSSIGKIYVYDFVLQKVFTLSSEHAANLLQEYLSALGSEATAILDDL